MIVKILQRRSFRTHSNWAIKSLEALKHLIICPEEDIECYLSQLIKIKNVHLKRPHRWP